MQDYVEDFSSKISSVDKVTQRIIKEQRGTLAGPPRSMFTEIIVCKGSCTVYIELSRAACCVKLKKREITSFFKQIINSSDFLSITLFPNLKDTG